MSGAYGSDGPQAKSVYEPVAKLEAFYTGGAVRIARDNQHMACACGDEVKILDVATGTVTRTLPGDSEPITSLALSPDKHSLVAASRSLTVRHWDWTTGECKRTWKPHRAPVADMAVDASGGFVATGSSDRSIKVTDLARGFITHHFTGHGGIVLRVLFHPKQLMLFSSDDQGEVRVWDLVTKAPAFKTMAKGHMSAVPALCLAPDGWHLLSGGRDKVVCVWDIRNGSKVATLPVYEALEGLAVLPMGSAFPGVLPVPTLMQQGLSGKAHFFATAGERGVVRIWRSDTGTCLYTYSGSSSSLLQGPAAGSSGSSKKKQKTALGASEVMAAAAGDELVELMLLPGGKGLLVATGDARLLFFHPKADEGGSKQLALTRQLIGNLDEVTGLAFIYNSSSSDDSTPPAAAAVAADGSSEGRLVLQPHEPRRLAVSTNTHDIRLFELSDASCVGGFVGHRDIVVCLSTVTPAPGVELLASGAKDSEVRVWDTSSGTCLAVAAGHVSTVNAVAWSRSKGKVGCYLATGGADKLLKLWDTSALLDRNTGRSGPVALSTVAAVAAHEKDVNALSFSPNDGILATASQDKTIKLWQMPSLVLLATLRGHKRGVWDIAFSPSEKVLLSCSSDKLLKLWSVVDYTCLRTFEGHTGGVLRCSFLTAGTQVVSSGADGLLKLWDTRTGTDVATFESHDNRLWGLAVSGAPDESLLASGGDDSRVVVWRDVTADKAAAAEAEEEELVIKQQELSNALADGDYAVAARLAFQLRHPGRLLEVLRRQPGGPTAALSALQELVGDLQPEDLATALSYCREWNTNTRNSHLAQVLLRAVLSKHAPEQILEVPGASELIGGLLAYSQRHASRLDRLMRSTFLLDYTLAASQVLLPADAHDATTDAAAADAAAANGAAAGVVAGQHAGLNGVGKHHHGKMNVLANGHGHAVSGSSDSSSGEDEGEEEGDDASLSDPESEDGSADEQTAAAAAAAAGNGVRQQQQQQQRRPQKAAATEDDDASKPDPQLPGWGGGDDLSDDWEGAGEEVEDDARDIMSSGDDAMGSGDDVMVSGDDSMGSEGEGEDDGGSSSGGEGSDGEGPSAEDADSEEGEGSLSEDEQPQQQQQQRAAVLKQQQGRQPRQLAAGKQQQQQRQTRQAAANGAASGRQKPAAAAAAAAAAGQSPDGRSKGAASPAGKRQGRRLRA